MMCFFFKQKTAYEMRISDWSSDVCSSDLRILIGFEQAVSMRLQQDDTVAAGGSMTDDQIIKAMMDAMGDAADKTHIMNDISVGEMQTMARSEERRVGNECVSTCRFRRTRYHSKKKKDKT